MEDLFRGPYQAGVRISTNSWGGDGAFAQYTAYSAELDEYVHAHPDFAVLFSASNDGSGNRYASLESEAVAKNVIAVGATQDGLLAHLAKIDGAQDTLLGAIPPLYQGFDGRGCSAVLEHADAFFIAVCPDPGPPTPPQCAELALAGQSMYVQGNGYNEYSFNYRPETSLELALCCGCTPQAIMDGLNVATNPRAAYYNLTSFLLTYNARWRADFSSPGPTLDGRIKPDVAMPGLDVVSARAAGPGSRRFGQNTCPFTSSFTTSPPSGTATQQYTITSSSEYDNAILSLDLDIVEALQVNSVSVRLESLSEDGFFWMLWSSTTHQEYVSGACYAFATASAAPFDLDFVACEHQLPPGEGYRLIVFADEGLEVGFTAPVALPAPTRSACFGSIDTDFLATLSLARGTAASFTTAKSGTSMATPAAAALVALIRQYYFQGFYPSGEATPAASFLPSAALLKATLINSATALVTEDFYAAFLPHLPPPTAAQVFAEAGFGVPNLVRGLSFPILGGAFRSSGALPTLLLPGLSPAGADPSVGDGGSLTFCIDVTGSRDVPGGNGRVAGPGPLSATLVYTDPPALPNALYALVNNLNLVIRTPTGTLLRGNNEQAQPNQQLDTRNNVEKLVLYALNCTVSRSGERLLPPYAVTVLGSFVPFPPQAFSLVLTGPLISVSAQACSAVPPASASPAAAPSPAPPGGAASGAAATAAPIEAGLVVGEVLLCLALFALGAWITHCYHRQQCCFKGRGGAQQQLQQQQQQQQPKAPSASLELGGSLATPNPMMQATAWR